MAKSIMDKIFSSLSSSKVSEKKSDDYISSILSSDVSDRDSDSLYLF